MTANTLATLMTGIFFTVLGIAASVFYRWRRAKTYAPLLIGLAVIYIATGPLSHSQEKIEAITHVDPEQVLRITLQPTRNRGYADISLVRYDRVISDSPTLHRLCHLLQQAVTVGEGYLKTPSRVGRLEITLRDHPPLSFGFREKESATCITVDSDGEQGWHYGLLDAPGLGPLLDSLSHPATK